jgi:hypothetical protein
MHGSFTEASRLGGPEEAKRSRRKQFHSYRNHAVTLFSALTVSVLSFPERTSPSTSSPQIWMQLHYSAIQNGIQPNPYLPRTPLCINLRRSANSQGARLYQNIPHGLQQLRPLCKADSMIASNPATLSGVRPKQSRSPRAFQSVRMRQSGSIDWNRLYLTCPHRAVRARRLRR